MPEDAERFQKILDQAHSLAWEGEWEQAVALYQKAIQLDPKQPSAWLGLGYAYLELGNLSEAFRAYQQASQLQPQDPIPLEKLARVAARLGHTDQAARFALLAAEIFLRNREVQKAIANWSFVTKCKPEEARARLYLAKVYEKGGQIAEAIREYLALAAIYQANQQTDQALQLLTNLHQAYPTRQEVQQAIEKVQRGETLPLPQDNSLAEGEEIFPRQTNRTKVSSEKSGADPITEAHQLALQELASLVFELDAENAPQTRSNRSSWLGGGKGFFAKSSDPTKIAKHLGAFLTYAKTGENELAIDELEKAIQAGLKHAGADFELGYHLYRKNEEAIKALQRATKNPTYSLAATLLIGCSYSYLQRKREAATAFLNALRIADVSTLRGIQAAEVERMYGPISEAILSQPNEALYDKVIEGVQDLLLRTNWRAHVEATRQQLNPRGASGIGELRPLGEVFTHTGGYKLIEAMASIKALAEAGHLRSAMEEAYYALDFMPNYLPLHIVMGELLVRMGLTEEAFMKFYSVARSYEIRGELDQAIHYYRHATEISPMNTTARQKLIQLLVESNQPKEAIQEYIHLGEVYYNLADLQHARETYLEAYQLAQDLRLEKQWAVMILHLVGDLDRQSLEWRQALSIYERIREIDPADEQTRLQLVDLNLRLQREPQAIQELDAYLNYLVQKRELGRAQHFLEKLLAEYPNWSVLRRRLESLQAPPRHLR
ncbi:MAG: tetratricopeptide repeat protein [Anaerolineales bacterium]|nr:tetratricopeptide repeat protein [Anaerolineales bacterium]MDW8446594.1 tetratricopeptide repeat protein [Anaerolineales bacterium]